MADTSLGFRVRGTLSGAPVKYDEFTFKDTETLTKGDLVNLESSEIDLAATGDTAILGVVQETKAGTDSTTTIYVAYSPLGDLVLGAYDANARVAGDTLDISGATGAQTVAATSNADLVIVASSTASEETLVKVSTGASVWV